jgi:hypothetical protein
MFLFVKVLAGKTRTDSTWQTPPRSNIDAYRKNVFCYSQWHLSKKEPSHSHRVIKTLANKQNDSGAGFYTVEDISIGAGRGFDSMRSAGFINSTWLD